MWFSFVTSAMCGLCICLGHASQLATCLNRSRTQRGALHADSLQNAAREVPPGATLLGGSPNPFAATFALQELSNPETGPWLWISLAGVAGPAHVEGGGGKAYCRARVSFEAEDPISCARHACLAYSSPCCASRSSAPGWAAAGVLLTEL